MLIVGWLWTSVGPAGVAHSQSVQTPGERRAPAVARANLRVAVAYDFLHVDETETTTGGPGLTTLEIPDHDAHGVSAEAVGTLPLTSETGARLRVRYRYGEGQRSLDGLERGVDATTSYGARGELFLRDPALGAFELGGGYDRRDADGGVDADVFHGSARAQIFFPDLGSGPVDWFVRFDFAHRQVSGVSGTTADIDADRYAVTGGAGWYLSDDFLLVLGGRWDRAEEEFLTEETTTGFGRVRIGLPVPGSISLELSLGGSAGVAELDRAPFRSESRLVYGAEAGLVLRFRSGESLLASIRGYD